MTEWWGTLMFGRTKMLEQQHKLAYKLQLPHDSNRPNTKVRHTMLSLQQLHKRGSNKWNPVLQSEINQFSPNSQKPSMWWHDVLSSVWHYNKVSISFTMCDLNLFNVPVVQLIQLSDTQNFIYLLSCYNTQTSSHQSSLIHLLNFF